LVTRIGCIRAREAHRRAPFHSINTSRPGFRKDPGLLLCSTHWPARRCRPRRSMDRTTFRWTLFNKLPQGDLGTGRRSVLQSSRM
jgi:hypothetical protein